SSHGPYLRRFEERVAARCAAGTALAVANGTVALHLALAAAGIGPGDEVVVPALTYVATANAVAYCGARPVFVDVLPGTWCIDPDQVAAAVGPRTRAVIAVDLYGHPADYPALRSVCGRHGLLLVADAAESFGATLDGRPTGSLADVSTFSFYANKILTCGEGGAVTTDDAALADRMRLLRNHGMDPDRRYFFPVIGYNYRLTNVAAAMLCGQLDRAAEILAARDRVVDAYERGLAELASLSPQPVAPGVRRSPWMASFLVGPAGDGVAGSGGGAPTRDELAARLDRAGVQTRPFFIPIPDLPPYRDAGSGRYPVTADLARRGINLPTYPELTDVELTEIVDRVRAAAGGLPGPAAPPR
ncbi:MAG TPA: DegT/DnrJ/EryC1/StrS family aminotransferase, partial [Rugosimonospora sp.]|nr:DegT/DnrJ/EryC1/StrS family aminotransferase [Rugosimonospora sp.]